MELVPVAGGCRIASGPLSTRTILFGTQARVGAEQPEPAVVLADQHHADAAPGETLSTGRSAARTN